MAVHGSAAERIPLDEEMRGKDQELEWRRAANRGSAAAIRHMHRLLREQEEITAQRAAELAASENRVRRYEHQLGVLLNSVSWRVTAPLRRLADTLPGRLVGRVLENRRCRILRSSGLFDEAWYLQQNQDVTEAAIDPIRHYLWFGAAEGRDPGPCFSTQGYLKENEDVAASGINPLLHYCRFGKKEGRTSASTEPKDTAADVSCASGRERPMLRLPVGRGAKESAADGLRIAVHLHLFYLDMLEEFTAYLRNIPVRFDLFVSTAAAGEIPELQRALGRELPLCGKATVKAVENRGRDIGPLVVEFAQELSGYDLLCHIHSKRSSHNHAKRGWRQHLLAHLLGSEATVGAILEAFDTMPRLGLLFPAYHPSLEGQIGWGTNLQTAEKLAQRLGLPLDPDTPGSFPAGSMFWARVDALRALFECGLKETDFEVEKGQVDGTTAHAIERLFSSICEQSGHEAQQVELMPEPWLLHYYPESRPYDQAKPLPQHERELQDFIRRRSEPKRIAVCTAICNDYDSLLLPEFIDPDIEYVCFSDRPRQDLGLWSVVPFDYIGSEPTRTARYVKTHLPHYFPRHEAVIWVDANVLIRGDLKRYVRKTRNVGAVLHPLRSAVREEAEECIRLGKDAAEVIEAQMNHYRCEGYDLQRSLAETGFIVFKGWSPAVRAAMTDWWAEISKFSKRDQLSFDYALHKNGVEWAALLSEGYSVRNHPDFVYFGHGGGSYTLPAFVEDYSRPSLPGGGSFAAARGAKLAELGFPRIDIIICVHNALDEALACLKSVDENLEEGQRLIIVDDCSDDCTQRALASYAAGRDDVLLIRHEQQQYYTKAANSGIRASSAPYLIFLNSDTIVCENWARKLVVCANSKSTIGIVGPLSNAASWQSIPEIAGEGDQTAINTLPEGLSPRDLDKRCEEWSDAERFPLVPLIHGFCLCVKREVVAEIGCFDEIDFPRGFGEEDDYCFRAVDAGFDLAIATHTYVYHAKSKSYTTPVRTEICESSQGVLARIHLQSRVYTAIEDVKKNPVLQEIRGKAGDLHRREAFAAGLLQGKAVALGGERELMKFAEISQKELTENFAQLANGSAGSTEPPRSAIWFIPFVPHALKGGIRTIFMTAEHFSALWGTMNFFVIDDVFMRCEEADRRALEESVHHYFPKMRCALSVFRRADSELRDLPRADIGFCTLWITAYLLAKYNNCRHKFYFMQDYEPLFYEAGSVSGAIEATYRFGFSCIANTEGVAQRYRGYSSDVVAFTPGVDHNVYYPPPAREFRPPYNIVFYGRPGNARNGFALGLEALCRVKERLGGDVVIKAVGSSWDPKEYQVEQVVDCLGLLPTLDQVAELYRMSHLGLVFMFTPHPSYQPLEYMATGCVTVTNRNPANSWLLKDNHNCALVEAVPGLIAERIVSLLSDPELMRSISSTGLRTVENLTWKNALDSIAAFVRARAQKQAAAVRAPMAAAETA